jgi:transcriptional regulator with GAF, ATPase, and Fis domain
MLGAVTNSNLLYRHCCVIFAFKPHWGLFEGKSDCHGQHDSITDALRQIATQTANSFQAEICVICLASNGSIVEKLAYGGANASAWLERQDLYEFLQAAAGEKPLCFQSLDIDKKVPAGLVGFLRVQRIQAFVAMPMHFEGVSLGTLSLFFASLKDFSDTDLRHLSVAANTVAAALYTGEDEMQRGSRYGNVFENIVGKSAAMRQVFDIMQRAAPTDTNLLISGESGTGKELIARGIHNLSRRKRMRSSPLTVSPCLPTCSKASFSDLRKALSPAPSTGKRTLRDCR